MQPRHLSFLNFPLYSHAPTYSFEMFIGYCLVLSHLTETGWLWYCQHCWMYCLHHRILASCSFQRALIGLSSFQPCFCQAAMITKSLANLFKRVSESFRGRLVSPGSDSEMRWTDAFHVFFILRVCERVSDSQLSQQFVCWTSAVQLLQNNGIKTSMYACVQL